MALEGTLKDFSLADIFQLIGIQKKTGMLVLREGEDMVRVSFQNGTIVGSEKESEQMESRLGHVLVKRGVISQEQLNRALEIQSESLQRLGQVVVENGFIGASDLKEALRNQVLQIVYSLFRWKNGHYHFSPQDAVDFDRENFEPISTESILMEGLRMLDEWPLIERVINDPYVVFKRTDKAMKVKDSFSSSFEEPSPGNDLDVVSLPHDQVYVLQLIDGVSSAKEIGDKSKLIEFETYRSLYDLYEGGFIEKTEYTIPAVSDYYRYSEERKEYSTPVAIFVGILFMIGFALSFHSPVGKLFPAYSTIGHQKDIKKLNEFSRLEKTRMDELNRIIKSNFSVKPGSMITVGEERYMLPGQYGLRIPFSIQWHTIETNETVETN